MSLATCQNLSALVHRREFIFKNVSKIHSVATQVIKDKRLLPSFEVRYRDLQALVNEFREIQGAILDICCKDSAKPEDQGASGGKSAGDQTSEEVTATGLDQSILSTHYGMEEKFFDMVYAIKAFSFVSDIDARATPLPVTPPSSVPSAHPPQPQAILAPMELVDTPKIKLPVFDGSPSEWYSFYSLFESAVHNRNNLSNLYKYQCLRSYLKGEPLRLLEHLPLSENNYQTAHDLLVQRYHNPRQIALSHIDCIKRLSPVNGSNYTALRHFVDVLKSNVAALRTLNYPTNEWSLLLVSMVMEKVDEATGRLFECGRTDVLTNPSFDEVITFLDNRARGLLAASMYHPTSSKNSTASSSNPKPPTGKGNNSGKKLSFLTATQESPNPASNDSCVFCKTTKHPLDRCSKFLSKGPKERFKIVKGLKLCTLCIHNLHSVRECVAPRCAHCDKSHHALLCFSHNEVSPKTTSSESSLNHSVVPAESTVPVLNCSVAVPSPAYQVVLSTAVVNVVDKHGQLVKARVLLDSASMANFISEKLATRLGLPKIKCVTPIDGLSETSLPTSEYRLNCTMSSRVISHLSFNFEAMVVPKITSSVPSCTFEPPRWSHLEGLELADPQFFMKSDIDILLGAEIVSQVLTGQRILGPEGTMTAFGSVLGFVLLGRVPVGSPSQPPCISSFFVAADESSSLHQLVSRFWEVERVPEVTLLSKKEQQAEDLYNLNLCRTESGRYKVPLLVDEELLPLGKSKSIAVSRLLSLERRLARDPVLEQKYKEFMQDYLVQNHMSCTPCDSEINSYYIPHHPVVKFKDPDDPSSMSIRVVFNASSPTENGKSLNQVLLPGRKLQPVLSSLLMRVRLHKYVVFCDIRQAYRQILVRDSDLPLTKIVWRFDKSQPVQVYQLNTLTYGTSSAPFLCLRTLKALCSDYQGSHSEACSVILRHSYIDDILKSFPSIEDARRTVNELCDLMAQGGFALHKWATNCPEILAEQASISGAIEFSDKSSDVVQCVPVLGLKYVPSLDAFTYNVLVPSTVETKRSLMSDIARLFDPLGFLAPVTAYLKIIMQRLWVDKLAWDSRPSDDLVDRWRQFKSELSLLGQVSVPRHIWNSDSACQIELHGFCDSSSAAYGAVVYMKFVYASNIDVHLIIAKSKIAPLQRLSIPRLELCACLLLTLLMKHVISSFEGELEFRRICGWSDSQVSLTWINEPSYRWKTFVANRVSEIHRLVPELEWLYIPSELNVADVISRGMSPSQLLGFSEWWVGPGMLRDPTHDYRFSSKVPPDSRIVVSEEAKTVLLASLHTSIVDLGIVDRFSSLNRLLRVSSLILRVIFNCRHPNSKRSGPIDPSERTEALHRLVSIEQVRHLEPVRTRIMHQKPHKFEHLHPFIDLSSGIPGVGLIRVGGRLVNAELPYDAKHPMLLPKQSHLTLLVIRHVHETNLHVGPLATVNLIRQQYWVISGTSMVKAVVRACNHCFRTAPSSGAPLMGNLPAVRVQQVVSPFHHCGVDYAGPVKIVMSRRRGAVSQNAYICLFVCLTVKAIHLELASELSTSSFLAAFQRFISRRGLPLVMYSDHGTNFVGCQQLAGFLQDPSTRGQIQDHFSQRGVFWHFIPVNSPHWGGIWESGVRSAKSLLLKTIGDQILSFEEMYTVLTRVEAVLNSRPLSPLSNSPQDLIPLTPGHFLVMKPLTAPPFSGDPARSLTHFDRLQTINQIIECYWRRWHLEYLNRLQQRYKWTRDKPSISMGTMVLIRGETSPPLSWPLGRVVETHPGPDGVVRVATVRTGKGLITRSVVKLCPLPTQ